MGGSAGFWIGLALSFPVGIAENFATPLVQRQLARTTIRWRDKLAREAATQEALVDTLKSDGFNYVGYLMIASLKIVVITAISGVLSGVFYLAGTGIQIASSFPGTDLARELLGLRSDELAT